MKKFLLLCSFVALFTGMQSVSAAILRVSQTGTGDYLTLGTAYSAAASGDTILIYSGTYNEGLFSGKRLTLLGAGIDQVLFTQQITFTTGSNRSVLEGVSIENSGSTALSFSGSADSVAIHRCRMTVASGHPATSHAGVSGARLFFEDCILINTLQNHAAANSVSCTLDSLYFRNCIFVRPLSTFNFANAFSGNPNSLSIMNCVFLGFQRVFSLSGSPLLVFSNNAAYRWVTSTAPTWGTYPVSALFHYNASSVIAPPGTGSLLLTANPFVNYDSTTGFVYGTSNLRPAVGSPLIDAGNPSLFDRDSTISDLGAYGGPLPFVDNGAPAYPFTVSVTLDNPIPAITDTVHVQSIGRIGPRY